MRQSARRFTPLIRTICSSDPRRAATCGCGRRDWSSTRYTTDAASTLTVLSIETLHSSLLQNNHYCFRNVAAAKPFRLHFRFVLFVSSIKQGFGISDVGLDVVMREHYSGKKTVFLRHLYIKIMILPRQARDKHRENSKKARFLEGGGGGELQVRRRSFLRCHFILNMTILSRHAWDKHKENSKQEWRFCAADGWI